MHREEAFLDPSLSVLSPLTAGCLSSSACAVTDMKLHVPVPSLTRVGLQSTALLAGAGRQGRRAAISSPSHNDTASPRCERG